MAITRITGSIDALKCTASADATNLAIRVRGFNFSHTAAGSFRLVAAGPAQATAAKLSTNAFLIERLTTTVNAKTIMLETPIPLPKGFTVYMTGTLILLL